jgi:rod shape-determining protein MreC
MKFLNKNYLYFVISIVISISLMVSYIQDKEKYNYIEGEALDSISPLTKLTSSGLYYFRKIADKSSNFFVDAEEVRAYKERNNLLECYFYLYKQLQAENQELKRLVNFHKNSSTKYLTSQVISRSNNALNQHIIIDSGLEQGIKKWEAAVFREQLVGRVVQVNKHTTKILLINDLKSHIPVIAIDSKTKFIASGQATEYLDCKYLSEPSGLKEGELVITSGDDTDLEPNIIVGTVFKHQGRFYVKPTINLNIIEFIQILQKKIDE